jgi:hypothetical protein
MRAMETTSMPNLFGEADKGECAQFEKPRHFVQRVRIEEKTRKHSRELLWPIDLGSAS